MVGVEPTRLAAEDFESSASTYSATLAFGPACRNRTHIRRVEADCIIHYTNARINIYSYDTTNKNIGKCVSLHIFYNKSLFYTTSNYKSSAW